MFKKAALKFYIASMFLELQGSLFGWSPDMRRQVLQSLRCDLLAFPEPVAGALAC